MGEDSDSDEPILAKRAVRSARSSVKSYSISSEEDGGSDGNDTPLSKQATGATRGKGTKSRAQDDDDGITDLTAESPNKKAKVSRERKADPKAEPKVEDVENLDEEEEELLLKLMSQHSSTSSSSKINLTPASKLTGVPKKAAASATKKEESGAKVAATPASFVEETTLGSARVESSKIKFSRSVPVLAPNSKKISRTTFLVQCEDPALDFEGDSGVIGTVKSSSESKMQLDIKGQLFEGSVLPSNSMMVVDVGASEVKIEAVMNNFVQLHKIQNPHDDNCDVDLSDSGDDQDAENDDAAIKSTKAKDKDKSKAKSKAKTSKGKTNKKAKRATGAQKKKAR